VEVVSNVAHLYSRRRWDGGEARPDRHFSRAGSRSIVHRAVTEPDVVPAPETERVAEARSRAQERLHRQRQTLQPVGWAAIIVVVLGSANSDPAPGLHGKALAVTIALCVFVATLASRSATASPSAASSSRAG